MQLINLKNNYKSFCSYSIKSLSLTPDGTILQEHAIKILDDMESIENNFSSSKNVRGELVVGCQEVLMWSWFQEQYVL